MSITMPVERWEAMDREAENVRGDIRAGRFTGQTGGLAPGKLQGNLVILPASYAQDFSTYCQRNPKPCPVVGVSDVGDPMLPALGRDIDVRTDLPGYNVFRDGELVEQVTDALHLWQDDFVAFVLGCSYSFENALVSLRIPLRHLEVDTIPPVYITSIETSPAGPFSGPMVVSMRSFSVAHAIKAIEITGRYPHAHGTPVHLGDPAAIGIADLQSPDWGPSFDPRPGEVSLFWACGVTPQVAVRNARPAICITHKPGCMLITDIDA